MNLQQRYILLLLFSLGHYVYYYTNHSLTAPDQLLNFPSHQFVCGLSFSYITSGPLDLEVIRQNAGIDTVISQAAVNNATQDGLSWESVSYRYNTTDPGIPSSGTSLFLEVSEFDLGEAPLELENTVLFVALDNVTLTFCLPCDYDSLVEPGTVIVGGPQRLDIQLRLSTVYQFNATSPACPNETLVFTIETGRTLIRCVI